ncbi:hypothetical protein BVRB_3g054840 [Beta vulgaris subsp. vulgaris]|nr:hypothetical protein BVRB_3g054840 [Beta vulgaris subsp. vulgaris]
MFWCDWFVVLVSWCGCEPYRLNVTRILVAWLIRLRSVGVVYLMEIRNQILLLVILVSYVV